MSELYEKLAKVRDENRESNRSPQRISFEEDVLKQLLVLAFTSSDQLPEEFTLNRVMLYQHQLESLMNQIGLTVTIEKVGYHYAYGYNYYCIIKAQG